MRARHLDTSGCMGPFLKAPRPPHWGWAPRRHVICPSPLLPGPPSPPTFTALGSYCFLHSLGTSHLSLWYFLLCLKKFTRLDLSRPSGLCQMISVHSPLATKSKTPHRHRLPHACSAFSLLRFSSQHLSLSFLKTVCVLLSEALLSVSCVGIQNPSGQGFFFFFFMNSCLPSIQNSV